ncbi:MAG: TetR/AcrR family transcriptional regulator [Deltaproteobacteria bacterium]|nr:TetR/AcrR family transcriptional regulator [Deltaproteobacteria bacterium]
MVKTRIARRRQSSRDELVVAAKQVALRKGMDGFTLDAVAKECGVTKQGLLYHFASKDELVFEVFMSEWERAANVVAAAVEETKDGAGALAAMITSFVAHFAPAMELFRLITQEVQRYDPKAMTRERFLRLRPINDRLYGGAEARLAGGKKRLKKGLSPRRLAFSAHLAAMGILGMKALVERFDDPLLYGNDELVSEMCRVFSAAAGKEG